MTEVVLPVLPDLVSVLVAELDLRSFLPESDWPQGVADIPASGTDDPSIGG